MEHPHYLLQNVLHWWHTNGGALASGALASFEKNALASFWRDAGNVITGTGAGWAATRDAFFDLFGLNVPAQQPQSGNDAVRNTLGSFLQQILEGPAGPGDASAASGSSSTATGSPSTQPPLSDLLPPEMGGKVTLADVVAADQDDSSTN